MYKKLSIIALIFSLALMPSFAYACSCIWPDTIVEKIDQTEVIFYGKVIKTKPTKSGAIAANKNRITSAEQATVFQIKEIWKGNFDNQKTVFHGDGNNCCYCGLVFEPGKYYLVLADYSKDDKIITNSCSGTEELSLRDYHNTVFDPLTPYNELIKTIKKIPSKKY